VSEEEGGEREKKRRRQLNKKGYQTLKHRGWGWISAWRVSSLEPTGAGLKWPRRAWRQPSLGETKMDFVSGAG
jgi:hypothetical protein